MFIKTMEVILLMRGTQDKLSSKCLRVEFSIKAAESAISPESLIVEVPLFSIPSPSCVISQPIKETTMTNNGLDKPLMQSFVSAVLTFSAWLSAVIP